MSESNFQKQLIEELVLFFEPVVQGQQARQQPTRRSKRSAGKQMRFSVRRPTP